MPLPRLSRDCGIATLSPQGERAVVRLFHAGAVDLGSYSEHFDDSRVHIVHCQLRGLRAAPPSKNFWTRPAQPCHAFLEQYLRRCPLKLRGLFSVIVCCAFPCDAAPPPVAHPGLGPASLGAVRSRSGLAETPYAHGGPEAWSRSYETRILAQTDQNPPPPSVPATPSQPQPPPAPQPVESQPAEPGQGQPAPVASQATKLEPVQVQDLLQKIYQAAFRFTDLLTVLQPDKWKMDDAARQLFNQALETVRGQFQTLDEDRKQFLEKPENSDLADKTDASITALLPNMEAVAAAVTQYDGPAQGTQYRQPADQLRELQKSLQPYAFYLHAKAEGLAAPSQPQTQAAPAAQLPAQTPQGQPAPATNQGTKLEPAQLKDLLQRIYVVTFRFTDLVGILQPDKWKMDDTARQSFNQALETVRSQLQTLDEDRKQFLEKPENLDLAGKTDASIGMLLPNMEAVAATVTQYDGPAQGTQYKQPADQLRELQKSLQPYVLYLRAKAEAGLAPIPGVETEVIQPSTTPMAILPTDISGPPPPMRPEQLKQVLYKMYVPTYRIQDVLTHEQPENLKASEAERASFSQARATLQAKLAEFEKVRNQFAASPASPDLAFQTYVSALSVQDPLEQVSKSLSTQGEAKLADEFRQRGRELIAAQQELVPYISYFVSRWDRAAQMFQSNLAACEKQLNYAMHFHTQAATPLPNINPEFQGHGHKTTSSKETATKAATTKAVKTTPSKKTAKQSSKQASAKASQAKS